MGGRVGKIDSGDFGCALLQYFSYYFAPPPLKYPLHTPAEKSTCFSNYDQTIKSIRLKLRNAVGQFKFSLLRFLGIEISILGWDGPKATEATSGTDSWIKELDQVTSKSFC